MASLRGDRQTAGPQYTQAAGTDYAVRAPAEPLPLGGFAAAGHPVPADTRSAVALALLCLLALTLRLRVGLNATYVAHPDATYDFLEQGFRLFAGYGVQTWTYQEGVRSWLLPGLLAGVMKATALVDRRPDALVNAVVGVMALLSLVTVVVGFLAGRRLYGLGGAIIIGFICATWFELVYFAPQTLSEVFAANFLVIGVYLCDEAPMPGRHRIRGLAAGLCLGLAVATRPQLLPAVGVAGLWVLGRDGWRPALRLGLGGAVPMLAVGLLDAATYDHAFQSLVRYLWANSLGGVADFYGRSPVHALLSLELHYLGGWLGIVALCAALGARRLPLPALCAAVIVLTHTLVPHKEYRFLYPAMPLIYLLAGLGTADLLDRLTAATSRRAQALATVAALALWGGASWAQAVEGPFRREWYRGAGELAAAQHVAARTDVCGIALLTPEATGGGLVRWGHDVPVFLLPDRAAFDRWAGGFNLVLAEEDNPPPSTAFRVAGCWENGWNEASMNRRKPRACVFVREGGCDGSRQPLQVPVLKILPWRKRAGS